MRRAEPPLIWRVGSRPSAMAASPAGMRSAMRLAASFAASAAASEDIAALHHEVCVAAAEGLGAEFVKLLIHDADRQDFLLTAGVGWRPGVVGQARLAADSGTAAGFAWHTGKAVITNALGADRRFRVEPVMLEHGIRRCLNVPIMSAAGPAAVLEVESARDGAFVGDDVNFIQVLARSLAGAQDRLARESEWRRAGGDDARAGAVQELQHRINNDLQLVCVSLDRETRALGERSDSAGYERVRRQVLAIAGLYRRLRSGDLDGNVDLGAFLADLCGRIISAAELSARGVSLSTVTEPFRLPAREVGLVAVAVNELIANAAEHAFPDGKAGSITLRLEARSDAATDTMTLTVSDDGCGFGPMHAGAGGLRHAERAVRASGGTLTRLDGAGTAWRITIVRDRDRDVAPSHLDVVPNSENRQPTAP